MKHRVVSHSEKETFAFAREFAKTLRGGEVVALIGDLGSGKTTFVRGLARAFGIREPIRSPTFTLMHIHHVKRKFQIPNSLPDRQAGKFQIRTLVHVDAYRLQNARELEEIGIGEYLGKPDTVVLIEWADRVKDILRRSKKVHELRFFHGKELERKIILKTKKARAVAT